MHSRRYEISLLWRALMFHKPNSFGRQWFVKLWLINNSQEITSPIITKKEEEFAIVFNIKTINYVYKKLLINWKRQKLAKIDSAPTGLTDSQVQARSLHPSKSWDVSLSPDHTTDGVLSQQPWTVCHLEEYVGYKTADTLKRSLRNTSCFFLSNQAAQVCFV